MSGQDDTQIGATIRALRTEMGMSQADLVLAVNDLGLRWYQQTVARVEQGTRPLRVSELVPVATALSVKPKQLLSTDSALSAVQAQLKMARWDLQAAERRVKNLELELSELQSPAGVFL